MNEPVRPFPLGTLRELFKKLRLPWGGRRPDLRPEPEPEREPPAEEVAAECLRSQVKVIREAFRETGVSAADGRGTGRPEDDADVQYLYRPGHLLVRDSDLERLERFFAEDSGQRFRGEFHRVSGPTEGISLVSVPSRTDGQDDVLATIEEIEARFGDEFDGREAGVVEDDVRRAVVSPDHVIYVTGYGKMCPATEPEIPRLKTAFPAPGPDTPETDKVRVAVVDTGLWKPAVTSPTTPWMSGAVADPEDEEHIDPAAIHPYGGHGTFVAGVVRCVAPGVRVEVEGVLTRGGAVYESEICQQLHEALQDNDHPQLISISAGTHTRGNFALITFEMLAAAHGLDDGEETLIVAAAGNDGSTEKFWPAAFPWVVAVGSVDPDGTVSDFSNYGDWVDVYARGRDIVNAFPEGTYTCYEPPNVGQVRSFKGLAQWSGTSFATPIVTGLIAARMSAASETARQAWASVLGSATSSAPPSGAPVKVVGPLS